MHQARSNDEIMDVEHFVGLFLELTKRLLYKYTLKKNKLTLGIKKSVGADAPVLLHLLPTVTCPVAGLGNGHPFFSKERNNLCVLFRSL